MSVKVRVPSPLRQLTKGASEVEVDGATVAEALQDLERRYPGFQPRIFEPTGGLRHFVNVYRNDDDIRTTGGLEATLSSGDQLSIVPAVAGGA
ncbi:MAG TPA: ubiquitin-like small modifier protein 1 [Candidatus Dormibacteraeota bacterium]|nr:ubiquitin-like small modifier protein 1 [Candidatus Dormibacteraeota bacterium]